MDWDYSDTSSSGGKRTILLIMLKLMLFNPLKQSIFELIDLTLFQVSNISSYLFFISIFFPLYISRSLFFFHPLLISLSLDHYPLFCPCTRWYCMLRTNYLYSYISRCITLYGINYAWYKTWER